MFGKFGALVDKIYFNLIYKGNFLHLVKDINKNPQSVSYSAVKRKINISPLDQKQRCMSCSSALVNEPPDAQPDKQTK